MITSGKRPAREVPLSGVHAWQQGWCGRLCLHAPHRLNAISSKGCHTIIDALANWRKTDHINCIVINSNENSRGFCAGGDILEVYENRTPDRHTRAMEQFAAEYTMVYRLATAALPTVCIADGIVMGGGAGVFVHCDTRIVTENTRFAMPETRIGFFPDVGASRFLSRLPGFWGRFLGMTGTTLGPGDLLRLGLATHFVPASGQSSLVSALENAPQGTEPSEILSESSRQVPSPEVPAPERSCDVEKIDEAFGQPSPSEVISHLVHSKTPWADERLIELERAAPLSAAVTYKLLTPGIYAPAELEIEQKREVFRQDYRLAYRFLTSGNLTEGIRARLIERETTPCWHPRHLSEVTNSTIEHFFSPLQNHEGRELNLNR